MKAKNGETVSNVEVGKKNDAPGTGWRDRDPVDFPITDTPTEQHRPSRAHTINQDSTTSPESLVMVMMPSITWKAFQDLAVQNGGSTAEAMSVALKLLKNKLDEEAENGS